MSLLGQIWAHSFSINITCCPHKGMDLEKIYISKMANCLMSESTVKLYH